MSSYAYPLMPSLWIGLDFFSEPSLWTTEVTKIELFSSYRSQQTSWIAMKIFSIALLLGISPMRAQSGVRNPAEKHQVCCEFWMAARSFCAPIWRCCMLHISHMIHDWNTNDGLWMMYRLVSLQIAYPSDCLRATQIAGYWYPQVRATFSQGVHWWNP